MAASKMAGWSLQQIYLSFSSVSYGSIDAMDSVKVPYVIFWQIQDGDIQDGGIQNGVLL